jgi:ribosomal protein S18 acetylase RimI-like enzyme
MNGELARGVKIVEARPESRRSLLPLLDQSFQGIYRWHARRTLRSAQWVRKAVREDLAVGLSMLRMVARRTGYIYYIAVIPSERGAGLGGVILDDALEFLAAAGAREAFASVERANIPSTRLFRSRSFFLMPFHTLARDRSVARAAVLWVRMMVAPGERVFRLGLRAPPAISPGV